MQYLELEIAYDSSVGDLDVVSVEALVALETWVVANPDKPLAFVLEVQETSMHRDGHFTRTTKARFVDNETIATAIDSFLDAKLDEEGIVDACYLGIYGDPNWLVLLKAAWNQPDRLKHYEEL